MAEDYTTTMTSSSGAPATNAGNVLKFPYMADRPRISSYTVNEKLFMGEHFDAFMIKIDDDRYNKDYARLRYVVANFAGLISKVVADLLFIEPPKIQMEDDNQQKWVDGLIRQNKFEILCYESALENSYYGDTLFKLRVGKIRPWDDKATVIISGQTPKIYYPTLNPSDVKGEPTEKVLAWIVPIAGKQYLRKETHKDGKIYNSLYLLSGNPSTGDYEILLEEPLSLLGQPDLLPEQDTKIKESLLIHIPNWRAGNRYFGISDYFDLQTLFYAINNRLTKIDNILDKHSDPILAIPQEILDEEGKVKKSALGLFVRPEDGGSETDPAYVTWDANLASAFSEIDKLVETLFMVSETSPDILGMGQGKSDSGRALKLKLLRTLAKTQRKQLYYTQAIKESIYNSMLLAKAWNLEVDGMKFPGDPAMPEIVWRDGLPADMTELAATETQLLDAGITSKVDSIQRVFDVDEDTAKAKAEEIDKESKLNMPAMNTAANVGAFGKNTDPNNPGTNPPVKNNPVNNNPGNPGNSGKEPPVK